MQGYVNKIKFLLQLSYPECFRKLWHGLAPACPYVNATLEQKSNELFDVGNQQLNLWNMRLELCERYKSVEIVQNTDSSI